MMTPRFCYTGGHNPHSAASELQCLLMRSWFLLMTLIIKHHTSSFDMNFERHCKIYSQDPAWSPKSGLFHVCSGLKIVCIADLQPGCSQYSRLGYSQFINVLGFPSVKSNEIITYQYQKLKMILYQTFTLPAENFCSFFNLDVRY